MEWKNDIFSSHSRVAIYGSHLSRSLRRRCIDSVDFIQRLSLEKKLDVHQGCVNSICWDDAGTVILSGSDDKKLCITDPFSKRILAQAVSGHRSNIFSAQFLPFCQNNKVVSCSGDGQISYTIMDREDTHGTNMFLCHYGTTYEVVTVPGDPHTFLSCGEDGSVRWFDLRTKTSCTQDRCKSDILINCRRAVTTLAVNPMQPYHLAVGCSDSSVRIFDRRVLGTRAQGSSYSGRGIHAMFSRLCPPQMKKKYSRPTSLNYDRDGEEVLVSYSTDYIYIFNLKDDVTEDGERESAIHEEEEEAGPHTETTNDEQQGDSVNPVKRLRLRGDWSDTGPKARPRSERDGDGGAEDEPAPRVSIVQRMSEMLSRWLEDTTSQQARTLTDERRTSASQEDTSGQPQTSRQQPESNSSLEAGRLMGNEATASDGNNVQSRNVGIEEAVVPGTLAQSGVGHTEETVGSPKETKRRRRSKETPTSASPDRGEKDERGAGNSGKKNDGAASSPLHEVEQGRVVDKKDTEVWKARELEGETSGTGRKGGHLRDKKERKGQTRKEDVKGVHSEAKYELGHVRASSVMEVDSDDVSSRKRGVAHPGDKTEDDVSSEVVRSHPVKETMSDERKERGSRDTTKDKMEVGDEENSSKGKRDKRKEKEGGRGSDDREKVPEGGRKGSPLDKRGGKTVENEESGGPRVGGQRSVRSERKDNEKQEISGQEGEEEKSERRGEENNPESEPSTVQDETRDGGGQDKTKQEENNDTCLPLKERQEDWNPKDRATKQFADPPSRRRKVSVSGVPGQIPGSSSSSSGPSTSERPPTRAEESVSNLRSRFETGNVLPASRPRPRRISPTRRLPHFSREVLVNTMDMEISDTDSEFDSEDDLVLRRPRHSSSSAEESRDPETTLRESVAASKSARLKEFFKNHRLRKEREEEEMLRKVKAPKVKMVFKGHRNSRTMIKEATFWGNNHVLSGSDCGHIFIWDRHTGRLVMLLEGDKHVVNCIRPHPTDPILATSGIDYDIKIWTPSSENPEMPADAKEVIRINEVMLEETRDTITIPPSFMLRMLASLNHLRTDSRATGEGPDSDSSDD